MTAHPRLARWLTDDQRALAKLVDEAPATILADIEVSTARQHLMESLEAAERAAQAARHGTNNLPEMARHKP